MRDPPVSEAGEASLFEVPSIRQREEKKMLFHITFHPKAAEQRSDNSEEAAEWMQRREEKGIS